MSRYIDADELIFFGFDNPDDDNLFEFVPKEFIDNAPTADVVEVVRCEDCKWWMSYHDNKHDVGYSLCSNPTNMRYDAMMDMGADDFCSRAERKSE